MQNVQDVMSSVRLNVVDKSVVEAAVAGEVVKKFRVTQPREAECRRPKLTTDRDQTSPLSPNQTDKHFQTSVVADKYLLLEQAEGSSLYRCVDVNTQEELVCKVSSRNVLLCKPRRLAKSFLCTAIVAFPPVANNGGDVTASAPNPIILTCGPLSPRPSPIRHCAMQNRRRFCRNCVIITGQGRITNLFISIRR